MKKIVVIGPESTGKTTLCEQLADHYKTSWCPEYAREYLLKHGNKYEYEDLLTIAKGQIELEDQFIQNVRKSESPKDGKIVQNISSGLSDVPTSRLLFIDTDMYVMKVWCEFVFGKCHRYILDQVIERKYDLYLLCNTDLPWTPDELREYPDLVSRHKLLLIYKDILMNQDVPWVEISDIDPKRLQTAITAVDTHLNP